MARDVGLGPLGVADVEPASTEVSPLATDFGDGVVIALDGVAYRVVVGTYSPLKTECRF